MKDAQHQREVDLQDKLHKRSVVVLFGVVSLVFVLLIYAMVLKEFDLVKIILGSSLAVAGGAGIANLFKGKK